MVIRNIVTFVLTIAIMAIVVIGLINFNLMFELWVKLLVGVLYVGVLFTIGRALFRQK